jgi:hypothetical protein
LNSYFFCNSLGYVKELSTAFLFILSALAFDNLSGVLGKNKHIPPLRRNELVFTGTFSLLRGCFSVRFSAQMNATLLT